MKNLKFLSLGLFAIMAMSFSIIVDGLRTVNVSESSVNWVGKKITGQHEGTVNIKSGSLDVENGQLSGGSFVIDMTSLTATDLEGEYLGKLNGHLQSDDFFGTTNHPEAKFMITDVAPKKNKGKYTVTGNMTIKDITKSISFDTQVVIGEKVSALADIVIDRTQFDVKYGSGSFFDNLGDKTIYDDFTLSIHLVAE